MVLNKLEKILITAISAAFLLWSAGFIYKSSFITIDGHRLFCLFDDAMISMRYAWNFSHGFGLVWNPGAERVEGYSNLLMTLLMALATLIFDKSSAALFIQITGAGLMLGIAGLAMRIADFILDPEPGARVNLPRLLVFICVLAYYPLSYWALMGMETGLLCLLLLGALFSAFAWMKNRQPKTLLSLGVLIGLAALTRNDSILFGVLIYAYILWETLRQVDAQKYTRQILASIAIALGLIGGQLLFRYFYYDDLLPNTYTLKLTGMPLLLRLRNGLGFILPFLVQTGLIWLLACFDLVTNFNRRKLLLLSICLTALGYQVYVGGDPWVYWRIMAPTVPLLIILFLYSLQRLTLALADLPTFRIDFFGAQTFSRKSITQVLFLFLVSFGLIFANSAFLTEQFFINKPYQAANNRDNVNTALALAEFTTDQASAGLFWAGSIPYYSERNGVDFLGKSDRFIAQLPPDISGLVSWGNMTSVPGHNKYDLNYSIKILSPTYIQGFKWCSQDLSDYAQSHYVNVKYKGLELWLLKDSPEVRWDRIN